MKSTASENDLVMDAYCRIKKHKDVKVCYEVPLLGRSVDLAYVRKQRVFTFEFKIRDWRRAIRQASDHLLGADYVFVCMPKRQVTPEMRYSFQEAEVGLAFYISEGNWPFEFVVRPPHSKKLWAVARTRFQDYIFSTQEML